MRTVSLRVRLAVFVILAMALLVAERTSSIVGLHQERLAAARTQVLDVVEQGVGNYNLALVAARSMLATVASQVGEQFCPDLPAILAVSGSVESLFVANADGLIVCGTTEKAVGLSVAGRDYFKIAMRGIANLDPVPQRLLDPMPAIYLAQPLFDDDGMPRGAVMARLGIDELFPKSFANQLGSNAEAIVVDAAGLTLTAFPDRHQLVGRTLAGTGPVRAAMARSQGTVTAAGPDGRMRLYGFGRLPASNMHLIVGIDLTAVTREVERATWRAGATLLAAIAMLLAGLWIAGERLIVAPVQALSRRLTRFGQGKRDEHEREGGRVVITELAPLTSAFEAMAEELTHREEALRSANRRLSSLASLDPLTGIANRRSFDAVFAVQWSTARHLGVLMIDVDDFKIYNDHYGHLDGDRCLSRIAQALAGAVAGTDVIARVGGEEFAVLLPGATLASAAELAERLRRAVEELGLDHASVVGGPVTVSIGCATCEPRPELFGGDLMMAADQALYAAKQAGRNRVRLAGLVRPGGPGSGDKASAVSATARRGAAGG
ncbi:diguanylate cyclase [Ancylobacter sonchi]|uniref:diguanylate cyclase n=1 Tax=Ancylobacter sonchi TaxID=1937790 RepID=UPI001BD35679|nr:diguanylate cyclase [Ancylobacter sonchi]MBS7533737.1 diguanylate cyclase [Ancylobacter sonchi]